MLHIYLKPHNREQKKRTKATAHFHNTMTDNAVDVSNNHDYNQESICA